MKGNTLYHHLEKECFLFSFEEINWSTIFGTLQMELPQYILHFGYTHNGIRVKCFMNNFHPYIEAGELN